MSIRVIMPGALSTIQDEGRFGMQNMGITTSGAMDQEAFFQVNRLLDNEPGQAVLEMTVLGPTLLFEEDTIIAYTGSTFTATAQKENHKQKLLPGETYYIEAGTTVAFGVAESGLRGYFAIQGGFQIPQVLGSASTNLACGFGGYQGRALLAGDCLEGARKILPHSFQKRKEESSHSPEDPILLRVIPTEQEHQFTGKGIETFYHSAYKVSALSNRMGCRLSGQKVEAKDSCDVISDGIVFGSIQIPANGQPIVLMADHQTVGGYAKIGTVLSVDLPKLAQAKPQTNVVFRKIDILEGQQLYLDWRKTL